MCTPNRAILRTFLEGFGVDLESREEFQHSSQANQSPTESRKRKIAMIYFNNPVGTIWDLQIQMTFR
jgi:hypothetical protein